MQASPHPCDIYPPEIIEWSAMQADPDHRTERQERASDILTDDDVMRAAPHVLDVMLATIGFARVIAWEHLFRLGVFSRGYGEHYVLVALTVSVSLIGVVLFGALIGAMLPFALRRMGFDPAAASAPFVATIVDVTDGQ